MIAGEGDKSFIDPTLIGKLPAAFAASSSGLFREFVSKPFDGIPPFLQEFAGTKDYWSVKFDSSIEAMQKRSAGKSENDRKELCRIVYEYNLKLGAGRELLRKIEKAGEGRAFFVLTGQQPGILGGSLLSVYKAFTTLALAKHLEKVLQIDCVPLYWVGSDDDDFDEIRQLILLSSNASLLKMSFPPEAHESSRPVGFISLDWVKRIWETLATVTEKYRGGVWLQQIMADVLKRSGDHGEAVASIIISLSGGSVAAVDGRAPYLRTFSKSLFTAYFDNEPIIKDLIVKRGGELEEKGFHSQLSVGEDSGIFIFDKGRRRKVAPESISHLEKAIAGDIEKCYPGVVLRSLVQDYVFNPLAVVLGPAEIAYRAQICDVYDLLKIRKPSVFPRMSATMVPPDLLEDVDWPAGCLRSIAEDPAVFDASTVVPSGMDEMNRIKEEFLQTVDKEIRQMIKTLDDKFPEGGAGRFARKISDSRRGLERAFDAISAEIKKDILKRYPWAGNVDDIFRPGGKIQERSLSLLMPYLYSGAEAGSILENMSAKYVSDVMDGRVEHYVYSL